MIFPSPSASANLNMTCTNRHLLSVPKVHGILLPPLEPVVAQLLEVLPQRQRRLVLVGQVLEGFHHPGVHVLRAARRYNNMWFNKRIFFSKEYLAAPPWSQR